MRGRATVVAVLALAVAACALASAEVVGHAAADEERGSIPEWTKVIFRHFLAGDIAESELLSALGFLIGQNIIRVETAACESAPPRTPPVPYSDATAKDLASNARAAMFEASRSAITVEKSLPNMTELVEGGHIRYEYKDIMRGWSLQAAASCAEESAEYAGKAKSGYALASTPAGPITAGAAAQAAFQAELCTRSLAADAALAERAAAQGTIMQASVPAHAVDRTAEVIAFTADSAEAIKAYAKAARMYADSARAYTDAAWELRANEHPP